MQDQTPVSLVVIGVVGAPHGVRGAVRINTALAEPMHLKKYHEVQLGRGGALKITSVRPDKGAVVVATFEGINTRDAAQALTHETLGVPRDLFPEAAEDEYYHADLIGLTAQDETGAVLGYVCAVHNFGAGDILEIGSGKNAMMVAFTKALVPQIDLEKKTLTLSAAALLQDNDGEHVSR